VMLELSNVDVHWITVNKRREISVVSHVQPMTVQNFW